ncbi:MAG: hypothetical protein M0R80_31435 [Proteobacteria bacterium]|jgi:hypothetical protein|nr:hypothetical protein [Pseudomonadota bacterium]
MTSRRSALVLLAAATCLCGRATPALAAVPDPAPVRTAIAIGAALSDDGDVVSGKVRIRVVNDTGEPLSSIPLWLYANRFADPEAQVTDRTSHWLYPKGVSAGGTAISSPAWNGVPLSASAIRFEPTPAAIRPEGTERVLVRVILPEPLAKGAEGELAVAFRTRIPERRGRFGRYRGTVSLGGDFFPRPLPDLTGRDPSLPPRLAAFSARLSIPGGSGAVIGDQVFPIANGRRTLETLDLRAESLPIVVMERMEISTAKMPFGEAVYVSARTRPGTYAWSDTRTPENRVPASAIPDLGRVDFADRAFVVLASCAAELRGIAPEARLPARLVLVEIPAFDRLAQWSPGQLLVSDRLFGLIPFERALAFHDAALAQELGAALAAELSAGEPPELRFLAAEVVGARVRELYVAAAHGRAESLKDVVGFAAFIPYVDNLLYAPEVPFREAYATSPEEEDPLRDAPWLFANDLPRGRRVLAKLEDLLGADAAAALVAEYAESDIGFGALLRERLGDRAARFEADWLGAYPKLNYRITRVADVPLGGGRFRHEVAVARDGAEAVEPLTVRMEDDDGARSDATWDGANPDTPAVWESSAPLDAVRLDPEGRLVESAELTDEHPLADDARPLPWRPPLLTRLLLWGDTETFEPNVQIGIALRRLYDVTNSIQLYGSYAPRSYGGSIGYYRYFGRKRTLNARTWYVGPSIGAVRVEETETASTALPDESRFAATIGTIGAVLGRDDRSYFPDPRSGMSFNAYLGYGFGRADGGDYVHEGKALARTFWLLSPRLGHVFALYGGAMAIVGRPPAAELPSLSNRLVLRAFDIDETYGRIGLYAVAEYRHDLIEFSGGRLPAASTFERLQGALFVGGGTTSSPAGYGGMFTSDRLFAEVGYGLRLHMLAFGLSQYLIALDVAVPFWPGDRTYELEQADGAIEESARAPFKIVFGITQTY